jgi:hypothetical protein
MKIPFPIIPAPRRNRLTVWLLLALAARVALAAALGWAAVAAAFHLHSLTH